MIHINDIIHPRTGGQFVYRVMYDELRRHGYEVVDLSTPQLVKTMCGRWHNASIYLRNLVMGLAEIPTRSLCFITSIAKFKNHRYVIITSSSPSFPVFGDITYHQPPVGIGFWRERIRPTPRSLILKYLDMSSRPIWEFSKRRLVHISNSMFTANIIKRAYGIDSVVLYPPVPVENLLNICLNGNREPWILVTRLTYEGGALLLPAIARKLPGNIKFVIIGRIDHSGQQVLQHLKRLGINYAYLGFVDDKMKRELLTKCTCFLHLGVNEPFGISVVEAMASGCIPIAHRSGAIPEYMPKELTYMHPEEATCKIVQIINVSNQTSFKELKEELRRRALLFNESIFRRKFMAIFGSITKIKLED